MIAASVRLYLLASVVVVTATAIAQIAYQIYAAVDYADFAEYNKTCTSTQQTVLVQMGLARFGVLHIVFALLFVLLSYHVSQ